MLNNESSGLVGWYHWDFGDGNTSILENPSHNYTENGPFTVSLTVLDYNGNPITKSIENLVIFNENIFAGDLNFDDELDILDLVLMINLILGQINDYSGILSEIADIDSNGSVDVVDIVMLVNIILD